MTKRQPSKQAYKRWLVYQILPVLWGTIWQISVNNWLRLIFQAGQDAINKKARTGPGFLWQ
ncbi:hypothetical protein BK025_11125 [Sodalis sp. TME1]|nr:hypothetical protein BK025_11125 [Sodalis sp. TME1]